MMVVPSKRPWMYACGPMNTSSAKLEGLEMLESGAAADLQAVSASACGGAPDTAAHHDVNRSLADGEPRVELDERGGAVRGSKRVGQPDLEVRIGPPLFSAVNGRNDPSWTRS